MLQNPRTGRAAAIMEKSTKFSTRVCTHSCTKFSRLRNPTKFSMHASTYFLLHAKFSTVCSIRIVLKSKLDVYTAVLCLCLTRPGRHPKIFRFRKFWRSYLAILVEQFAQDHESGLRSDQGPVVLCDLSMTMWFLMQYSSTAEKRSSNIGKRVYTGGTESGSRTLWRLFHSRIVENQNLDFVQEKAHTSAVLFFPIIQYPRY